MEHSRVPEERFERLRNEITDYEEIKGSILTGIEDYEKIEYQKKKILKYLNASEKDYSDYHWQIKNRFTSAEALSKIIDLSEEDMKYINEVASVQVCSIALLPVADRSRKSRLSHKEAVGPVGGGTQ